MKKLVLTTMVLGSTALLAACAGNGSSMDATEMGGPYAEERTVGATEVRRPVVRSAQPVFEERQYK